MLDILNFNKKIRWYKIGNSTEDLIFGPNNITQIEVGGKIICMAKGTDSLYAFAQKCPHAGGLMSEGFLDSSDNILCPVHRYKYDLRNGRNVIEGYYLKTFKVDIRENGVFIGFE